MNKGIVEIVQHSITEDKIVFEISPSGAKSNMTLDGGKFVPDCAEMIETGMIQTELIPQSCGTSLNDGGPIAAFFLETKTRCSINRIDLKYGSELSAKFKGSASGTKIK